LQKWQRYFALILLIAVAVFAVTGCSPGQAKYKPLDPKHASAFDRYLVIPFAHMLDYFKNVLGNYGLSILVMTFLVRLIILPLTWKQQKSTKAMQELQPELNRIRDKYKNNPQKMQEETMKLFQQHGVNPMAGCLPMLVQFPILIAFYRAIVGDPNIAHSSFLWLQLGKPDPYFILPLLAAFTTYLQFIATGAGDNPQMRVMVWVMPAMIFFLAYQFAAALSLYWVYGNIFTILQYLLIFKRMKNA
jgi:YidC/Oxa1 family membrane protein insertase